MRIIEEIDLFLHGVALQFQANANWVARINFGTSANRVVPYSNQPPTTNLTLPVALVVPIAKLPLLVPEDAMYR